jgi:hypothetical protein
MTPVNYATMSDQELKQYFLSHRDDQAAFHAYMDRRYAKPRKVISEAGVLDNLPFDEQMKIVDQQMRAYFKTLNIPIPDQNPEVG